MADRYNQPHNGAQHHFGGGELYPDNSGYSNSGGYASTTTTAIGHDNGFAPAYAHDGYAANSYPHDATYDKEKAVGSDTEAAAYPATYSDPGTDMDAIDPHSGVKRGLKTRHLSMLALAGIIGPGLLIGAGGALANGGPAALIIGFGVIGIIAFSIMQSLGELTTLYPTGGAFTGLADRFVDKGFGVALGWNYFIIWFCVLANEYNVLTSIFSQWPNGDRVPQWGYFLIFWVS